MALVGRGLATSRRRVRASPNLPTRGGSWRAASYNSTSGSYEDSWDTTAEAEGGHDLEARATDSGGNTSTSSIAVTVDNEASPGGGMYVWAIDFSQKSYGRGGSFKDVTTTVTIRQDSDGDGAAESTDDPVADATVELVLTHDSDGDGVFECGTDDECWTFSGTTDVDGPVSFTLKRVETGDYLAEVTALTHASLTRDASLDRENPDGHTVQ